MGSLCGKEDEYLKEGSRRQAEGRDAHKFINIYSAKSFSDFALARVSPLLTEILTAGCVIPNLLANSVALTPNSLTAQ